MTLTLDSNVTTNQSRQRAVSVAIATYNGRQFIREQLESLVSQTLAPIEIVICDDGSTDGTLEEIENFSENSPVPISLHRNETRLGYSDNFLKSAHLSRGEYIAFCDQDDVWLPEKLEKCLEFMTKNNLAFCAHPARAVDENGHFLSIMDQGFTQTKLIAPLSSDPWGVFYGFTQIFHRSVLDLIPEQARGLDSYTFSEILSHDRWIYFLASNFFPIGYLNETFVNYRQHSSNLYGVNAKTLRERFLAKTREGPGRLEKFADLAGHRVDLLKVNRTEHFAREFDSAISRWKWIHYFCDLRVKIYSSKYLAVRLFYLGKALCLGAYLPFRFHGLGPKRLVEDISLGLFGSFFALWHRG